MSWKRIAQFWKNTPKTADTTDKKPHARLFLLQGVLVLIFAVLLHRLWELQIVNGPKYAEEFELKTTRSIRDGSLRGNIIARASSSVYAAGNPCACNSSVEYAFLPSP